MEEAILSIEIPELKHIKSGKVRDLYDAGENLLIVASDRISAFDCVMPNGIPEKGKILTQISLFWFDYLKNIVKNHLISADYKEYPFKVKDTRMVDKRSMYVKKTKVIPVECVVRGYLSGSGLKEYNQTQSICGIKLPAGLRESDKLPEPIFTPTTKEDTGHDMAVDFKGVVDRIGQESADFIKEKSIALYQTAANYASTKGIIIADTKFEFGVLGNEIILIDEALTPDSSRFWPKDQYQVGISPPSFDKQFVRDYLETLKWDKTPPAPALPADVVAKTKDKYMEAFRRLTNKEVI